MVQRNATRITKCNRAEDESLFVGDEVKDCKKPLEKKLRIVAWVKILQIVFGRVRKSVATTPLDSERTMRLVRLSRVC